MSIVKKSISITDHQNGWLSAQIATGHYGSESEVIRELIRERQQRDEETSLEIATIRQKLIAAEQSGASSISADVLLSEIKADMRRHGQL